MYGALIKKGNKNETFSKSTKSDFLNTKSLYKNPFAHKAEIDARVTFSNFQKPKKSSLRLKISKIQERFFRSFHAQKLKNDHSYKSHSFNKHDKDKDTTLDSPSISVNPYFRLKKNLFDKIREISYNFEKVQNPENYNNNMLKNGYQSLNTTTKSFIQKNYKIPSHLKSQKMPKKFSLIEQKKSNL